MPFSFQRRGMLIVISAPSGAGKSSIIQGLMPRVENLRYSISATSRPPRGEEQNGREYFFLTRQEFQTQIRQGQFLEYAEVHGNFYGTPRRTIEESLAVGTDVLLDIDVQGGVQVRQQFPDAVLIFIAPPSMEELEQRLRGRGSDTDEVIKLRLRNARLEMVFWPQYDYLVINNQLEQAQVAVENIIRSERCRTRRLALAEKE